MNINRKTQIFPLWSKERTREYVKATADGRYLRMWDYAYDRMKKKDCSKEERDALDLIMFDIGMESIFGVYQAPKHEDIEINISGIDDPNEIIHSVVLVLKSTGHHEDATEFADLALKVEHDELAGLVGKFVHWF